MKKHDRRPFCSGYTKSREDFQIVEPDDEDSSFFFTDTLTEEELLDLVKTSNYDLD